MNEKAKLYPTNRATCFSANNLDLQTDWWHIYKEAAAATKPTHTVMGTENIEAPDIDHQGESNGYLTENGDGSVTSAHPTGRDPWYQIGMLLVTSFNCGYILSFSNLMLRPLGWQWGLICLLVVGFYTAYANWLLAAFHFVDGKRFTRYRDLMGHVYGKNMYYITWILQFFTLLLINMGFTLLAAIALKGMNAEVSDSPLRIQYYIVLSGVAYFMFAFFIPTMSAMKMWLGVSAFLTTFYILLLLLVLVKDGRSNTSRNYEIPGSKLDQVFNSFSAISAILFCNTSGLLPEMQSALRSPEKKNMRKALYFQFTVGLAFYYGVSIVGYWAYGSFVSSYLPQNLTGPKSVKILINAAVFLQSIISQHMYGVPIHETVDTKFMKLEESTNSKENMKRRAILRGLLFSGTTFVTAAFPFMGDFVNLFGSFTLVPLTFVFPSLLFIKVKGKSARIEKHLWHWFNIILFSLLAVVTTISAVRSIVSNVKTYSFFADPYI